MNYIVESEGRQEQEMGRRKSVDKVSIRLAERTLMTYVEKFRSNATSLGTWGDGQDIDITVLLAAVEICFCCKQVLFLLYKLSQIVFLLDMMFLFP